jgi:hypothetical protein
VSELGTTPGGRAATSPALRLPPTERGGFPVRRHRTARRLSCRARRGSRC